MLSQELLSVYLKRQRVDVTMARDGVEALRIAEQQKFDLILMDIQMPVMDGITATEMLRHRGIDIPIIGLTADAMEENLSRLINAGCNAYLTKPISFKNLQRTLETYLVAIH
jgi:CheY-like chemotaxis protein